MSPVENWNLIEFTENIRLHRPIIRNIHFERVRCWWQKRSSGVAACARTYMFIMCSMKWYNLIEWFPIIFFFGNFICDVRSLVVVSIRKKMGVLYHYLLASMFTFASDAQKVNISNGNVDRIDWTNWIGMTKKNKRFVRITHTSTSHTNTLEHIWHRSDDQVDIFVGWFTIAQQLTRTN